MKIRQMFKHTFRQTGTQSIALGALILTASLLGSPVHAQDDKKPDNIKPAPVVIRFAAHRAHANDFMVRRNKDRSIEFAIKNKGIDVAYTEWMQRDHPFIFAKECVKEVGGIATSFKSTNHMLDFDVLLSKRSDLRLEANKYGHDIAFAEWLRKERPDVYRHHFGLDKQDAAKKAADKKIADKKIVDKKVADAKAADEKAAGGQPKP